MKSNPFNIYSPTLPLFLVVEEKTLHIHKLIALDGSLACSLLLLTQSISLLNNNLRV